MASRGWFVRTRGFKMDDRGDNGMLFGVNVRGKLFV